MAMRKLLIAAVSIFAGLAVLGLSISWVQDSRIARGVTIVVRNPDFRPIPRTIIQLKTLDGKVTIQNQTNEEGKLNFQKLTRGIYHIRATQVSCDAGATEVRITTLTIDRSNRDLYYYPCG